MSEKKIAPGGFQGKNTFCCAKYEMGSNVFIVQLLGGCAGFIDRDALVVFQVFYSIVERVSMAPRRKHEA